MATLQRPDRSVPLVEQRLGHDAHRIGEVDYPGAVGAPRRRLLGDLEHHRHGAQRLGQSARSRRLLAEAAVADGQRLVGVAGGLAPHPELDDHEVGPVDGRDAGHRWLPAFPASPRRRRMRSARPPTASRRSSRPGRAGPTRPPPAWSSMIAQRLSTSSGV